MNVEARYHTRTGDTRKLAEAIADEEFPCRGAFTLIYRGKPDGEDLKDVRAFARKVVSRER